MRPLTLEDFSSTGWNLNHPNVLALVQGILAHQEEVFAKYGIVKGVHVACMMGQFAHESGEGEEMTESLNYKPAALLSQWRKHFTPEQAMQYGRTADHPANQRMIGELAYGGRMGNAPAPSSDGYDFRGRGLIQTTGRDGYEALKKLTGIDCVSNPDLLNDPTRAFELGVAEFVNYPNMLKLCERKNIKQITLEINGGYIGLDDRIAQTALWSHRYEV
jgi:putative chitinase